MATPTTVYLTSKQRTGLLRRAKRRKTSFSEELRTALDLYLELPPDVDLAEFDALVKEANASMDRSIARMDEAIAFCQSAVESVRENGRR